MKNGFLALFANAVGNGKQATDRMGEALGLATSSLVNPNPSSSPTETWPAGQRKITAEQLAAELERDTAMLRQMRLAAGPQSRNYNATHLAMPRIGLTEVAHGLKGHIIGPGKSGPN